MKIISPSFLNNDIIPKKYTCDGDNVNPPLLISEIPNNTKSLVLIVDDLDNSSGNWNHWIVWNINPLVGSISENSIPQGGIVGINNFKKNEYSGPCPLIGIHRYRFKVYALNNKINFNSKLKQNNLESKIEKLVIGQSEFIGLYKRDKNNYVVEENKIA